MVRVRSISITFTGPAFTRGYTYMPERTTAAQHNTSADNDEPCDNYTYAKHIHKHTHNNNNNRRRQRCFQPRRSHTTHRRVERRYKSARRV